MKENVTTPPGREAVVSMLGNPEAFKMCVCIQCVLCIHTFTKSETCHHATLSICSVADSHQSYKGDGCIFHTITTEVCVALSGKRLTHLPLFHIFRGIRGTFFVLSYFKHSYVLVYISLNDSYRIMLTLPLISYAGAVLNLWASSVGSSQWVL